MKFNLLFKGNFPGGRIKRKKKHTYPGGNVESHAGEGVNKTIAPNTMNCKNWWKLRLYRLMNGECSLIKISAYTWGLGGGAYTLETNKHSLKMENRIIYVVRHSHIRWQSMQSFLNVIYMKLHPFFFYHGTVKDYLHCLWPQTDPAIWKNERDNERWQRKSTNCTISYPVNQYIAILSAN